MTAFTPTDITNRLGDTAAQSITVNPATVSITLGGLAATYDGSAHAVTVTTVPADVPVNVTYASSTTAPTDAGSYAVEATSADSNTTGSASGTLIIAQADPVITWIPSGAYADGDPLDAAALNATADVIGTFTYTPAAGTSLTEGNVDLSVEFVPADSTNYTTVTAQRSITVTGSGLAITTQPSDQTVIIGSPATFTVVAAGGGTITYQWRRNGVEIAGATNATYTIETTTLNDTDSYDAVVNNGAESATSDTVSLTVVDVVVFHEVVGTGYTAEGTVTISSTVTYHSAITSIGWSVLPPDPVDDQKWTFQIAGGEIAQVSPFTGDTDLFDFAWTRLPASPFTFTYTLNVPANATGQKSLVALVKPRFNGKQLQALVPPDPLTIEAAPPYHSADINQDLALNLTELLRVIELYNTRFSTNRTGRYKVSSGTEDGFAAEPTIGLSEVVTLTRYHSGDYDQDGKLSLTELLRIIELYNYRVGTQRTGQYHPQAGTDDGFAAGPGN